MIIAKILIKAENNNMERSPNVDVIILTNNGDNKKLRPIFNFFY